MIQSASQFLITDVVIAGILAVAVVAVLIEFALRRLQQRFSPWLGRMS
jgi:taurine transport system permease protein